MKRTSIFYSIAILGVASLLTFTACKKKKEFKNEDGQSSEDNRNTATENDNALNDVNDIMASSSLKGRGEKSFSAAGITGTITGASIDSINIGNGTIKINFDGVTSVNNRIRGGAIRLTVQGWPNVKWKDAGAVTKVEFLSYKVTKTSNGNYVELNGSQLYKNVSGTTWWDLLITTAHKSIISEVTADGGLTATFSDGKTATYNINRRITYSYLGPHPQWRIQCSAEGIGSSGGLSNLENYGTTRDGDAFTSQVSTPIVWNTDCGWWAPIQGAVSVKVADKDFSLDCTFGVDNKGTPVTVAPNSCAYGWKVEWKYKKKTNKKLYPY